PAGIFRPSPAGSRERCSRRSRPCWTSSAASPRPDGRGSGVMARPIPPDDVTEWLRGLGLEKYAGVFAEQEIGLGVLGELSDADLRDLGIPMGPRKLMLRAIGGLVPDRA